MKLVVLIQGGLFPLIKCNLFLLIYLNNVVTKSFIIQLNFFHSYEVVLGRNQSYNIQDYSPIHNSCQQCPQFLSCYQCPSLSPACLWDRSYSFFFASSFSSFSSSFPSSSFYSFSSSFSSSSFSSLTSYFSSSFFLFLILLFFILLLSLLLLFLLLLLFFFLFPFFSSLLSISSLNFPLSSLSSGQYIK